MSQERTEKATPKRRQKAREEGQVAKSRELSSALSLFFLILFFLVAVPPGFRFLQNYLTNSLTTDLNVPLTVGGIQSYVLDGVTMIAIIALPVLFFAALVGCIGEVTQVGLLFTAKLIAPKLDKLNPLKGFQRIFSKRSLVELVKSLLKAILLSYVVYTIIKGEMETILSLSHFTLDDALSYTGGLIIRIGIITALLQLIVGSMDYAYQWWEFEKSIRMSKKELQDEFKEMEGDPYMQGKIKERRRLIAQQRMMQAVPKANVVITNPTHLAIALQYEQGKASAPIVVAKGSDQVAKRIIALAKEHRVPVMENKPLAQTLFKTTEVGSEIPVDLYQAVAEILAFVYRLQKAYS